MDSRLAAALQAIEDRGQRRVLHPSGIMAGGRIERAGQLLLDCSSNDYLGLARHPLLIERARDWTLRYGAGSGASRLVTGTLDAHLALEHKVAQFKRTEAALFFASGWQANASVLPALLAAAPGAAVFTDRLVHASLHLGCAAAGAREIRFRHNDLADLERLIADKGTKAPARIIITESVFSMDGDRADIAGLAAIAQRHDAFLFVDEAHATGVLGPGGAGLSALVHGGVDLVMGTFSKALGGFGAYVAGSQLLCDYLLNTCGGFIFSTAPPPAVLGAADAALDIVPAMDDERAHLAALGDYLRSRLRDAGFAVGESSTQIVPAIIGDARRTAALSQALAERGILAAAIRPPTVPPGTSRLRLALRSSHGEAEVEILLAALRELA
jgi:8-amino-7-oxononanoate synthase